jgi:hypothetical protein
MTMLMTIGYYELVVLPAVLLVCAVGFVYFVWRWVSKRHRRYDK